MIFAVTETQRMLADMAGRLLERENSFESRRRRLGAVHPDRLALWPTLAAQGILGAALPEDAGGFGEGVRDLAVVMAIVGQRLVVEPLLAAAVCGRILNAGGDAEQVNAIMAGNRIVVLAHTEGHDPFADLATTATPCDDGYLLTGTKVAIRHADLAHGFIVTAALGSTVSAFLVEAGARGLERDAFRLIDSSSAATLHFANTPARLLAGADAVQEALQWSLIGLAAETAGIIDALNAATFAYMGVRKQFGAFLATFQALQHRAADMFAGAEEVRALTALAIDATDAAGPSRFALACAVKALADDAGLKIGHEAVQIHGGMGVSDELDVSHYMRRLAVIRSEFGGADIHRAHFATLAAAA